MSDKWSVVRLDELFDIGSSKRVMKSDWSESGVPFYRGREISMLANFGSVDNELHISEELYAAYAEKYGIPAPGDLMMTAIGTVGNVWVVETDHRFYFKDASVLWLAKISDCSSEYIKYWMKSQSFFDQLKLGVGATVDSLTIGRLSEVEVPLPPLEEQKRIVAKLDQALGYVDELSTSTQSSLQELDALWSSALTEAFCSENESNKSWSKISLKDSTNFFTDGDWIESKDQAPDGIRLVQTGNIGIGDYKPNDHRARFISEETFVRLNCTDVLPGDVLVSRLPDPIGRACIVPDLGFRAITGVDCSIVRFSDKLLPEFFVYYSQSKEYLDEAQSRAGGSTRQRISRKNLGEMVIPLPSVEDQRMIIKKLASIKNEIETLNSGKDRTIQEAEKLRASILSAAFAGDL